MKVLDSRFRQSVELDAATISSFPRALYSQINAANLLEKFFISGAASHAGLLDQKMSDRLHEEVFRPFLRELYDSGTDYFGKRGGFRDLVEMFPPQLRFNVGEAIAYESRWELQELRYFS